MEDAAMTAKRIRKPAYSLHKPSGQARVRIAGKDHYLGLFDSPESYERYDDLIAEWRIKHCVSDRYKLTIDDLALLYLEHAKQHYRKNGEETSEVHCVRSTLRYLVAEAGTTRAREFGPKLLKTIREQMIADGLCRTTINQNVSRIRRIFRWGIAEELLPGEILTALEAVQGLRKGRCHAVEPEPVRPVPQEAIDAIRPYVSSTIWAMIRLQLLTGMRPGEIVRLRPCDLKVAGDVWEYVPQSHKTEHHERSRRIFLGPRSQAILRPFLTLDPKAYCFSPRDAVAEHLAKGGCDPTHQFSDLGRVVRSARIHEGIRIVQRVYNQKNKYWEDVDIDKSPLDIDASGNCQQHYLLAQIIYPDQDEEGWLIYLKPSCTGDEGVDLLGHRSRVSEFPHESTVDQFFDPIHVECYRKLGFHIGESTLSELFGHDDHWLSGGLPLDRLEDLMKSVGTKRKLKKRRLKSPVAMVKTLHELADDGFVESRRQRRLNQQSNY
jgi:integrase